MCSGRLLSRDTVRRPTHKSLSLQLGPDTTLLGGTTGGSIVFIKINYPVTYLPTSYLLEHIMGSLSSKTMDARVDRGLVSSARNTCDDTNEDDIIEQTQYSISRALRSSKSDFVKKQGKQANENVEPPTLPHPFHSISKRKSAPPLTETPQPKRVLRDRTNVTPSPTQTANSSLLFDYTPVSSGSTPLRFAGHKRLIPESYIALKPGDEVTVVFPKASPYVRHKILPILSSMGRDLDQHAFVRHGSDVYSFMCTVKAHEKGIAFCDGLISTAELFKCIDKGDGLTLTLNPHGLHLAVRWMDLLALDDVELWAEPSATSCTTPSRSHP